MKLIDHGVIYSGGKILEQIPADIREAKNKTQMNKQNNPIRIKKN